MMVQATPILSPNPDLEHALRLVRAAGYRVSKPRARTSDTVNPFGHPFPHARLRNVTLTSIERLSKPGRRPLKMIEHNDVRPYGCA